MTLKIPLKQRLSCSYNFHPLKIISDSPLIDDSDEDLKPTQNPERKTNIHAKPQAKQKHAEPIQRVEMQKQEERKTNIEKEQDDEMERLQKLEKDIENMAKDFTAKRSHIFNIFKYHSAGRY